MGEHAPDLPVAALIEDQSEPRPISAGVDDLDRLHLRSFRSLPGVVSAVDIAQINTLTEFLERLGYQLASDGDLIDLWNAVTRMGQLLQEFAIIGQEKQALAFHVQASNWEDADAAGMLDDVRDTTAALGVCCGTDDIARLVVHDHDGGFVQVEAVAFNGDAVLHRIDPCGEEVHNRAVDLDLAALDQGFALAA